MDRGELWTVSDGTYAQKPGPALIIQDDLFAMSESVTLLPLTSQLANAPLLRLTVEPGQLTGLERVSQIMVDKLTTVRRTNLGAGGPRSRIQFSAIRIMVRRSTAGVSGERLPHQLADGTDSRGFGSVRPGQAAVHRQER
ncbi:type II toxin-antitoxin system PemK/MazF family toxin [Arthrobacter sp. D1-29]